LGIDRLEQALGGAAITSTGGGEQRGDLSRPGPLGVVRGARRHGAILDAQRDDGRAVAPLVGSARTPALRGGVAAQVLTEGIAESPGAVAVHQSDLRALGPQRAIEKILDG